MPGFRFNFEPEQIAAIAQYLKTVPPQAAPAQTPAKGAAPGQNDD